MSGAAPMAVRANSGRPDTRPCERHGAGMNHIGFQAPLVVFAEQIAAMDIRSC